MKTRTIKKGFSLTEVLMAMGIFTIAMLFIAAVFPVAIRFTNISTDRINASAATDEALAKVRLYGSLDTSWTKRIYVNECNDFNNVIVDANLAHLMLMPDADYRKAEYRYPSVEFSKGSNYYYWSALCRRVDTNNVEITIFISKSAGNNARYYPWDAVKGDFNYYPRLVKVAVTNAGVDELKISVVGDESFVNAGDTIVCNSDGVQYRILERFIDKLVPGDTGSLLRLDREWIGGASNIIWLIPGPVGNGGPSGKSTCVYVSPAFPVSF
jgi:prepilin-type N-terminal cleavage/methylation domain-containing protein